MNTVHEVLTKRPPKHPKRSSIPYTCPPQPVTSRLRVKPRPASPASPDRPPTYRPKNELNTWQCTHLGLLYYSRATSSVWTSSGIRLERSGPERLFALPAFVVHSLDVLHGVAYAAASPVEWGRTGVPRLGFPLAICGQVTDTWFEVSNLVCAQSLSLTDYRLFFITCFINSSAENTVNSWLIWALNLNPFRQELKRGLPGGVPQQRRRSSICSTSNPMNQAPKETSSLTYLCNTCLTMIELSKTVWVYAPKHEKVSSVIQNKKWFG